MCFSPKNIREAIDFVEAAFPFPNYFTEGSKRALTTLIHRLSCHIQGGKLLDIGSGPMDKTMVFQKLGFQCSAIDDLEDPWHKEGNHRARILEFARKGGITFRQRDADDALVFERESFDVVTILAVIEHLHESPKKIFNQAGASLKPNGLLCVTMPNSVNLRKRISVLMGKSNYPSVRAFFENQGIWRGHVREYTLEETEWLCREMGFEILESFGLEGVAWDKLPEKWAKLFVWLTEYWPTLRSSYGVICRKPEGWKALN